MLAGAVVTLAAKLTLLDMPSRIADAISSAIGCVIAPAR
jgi:hypothetical protein